MPEPTKAAPHQRVTLARIAVGDQLMTSPDTAGRDAHDRPVVDPHRFSDGTVRTVAERIERKARPDEMPGKLITLVFTDGTRTAERYGTTGHYPAGVFGL